MKLRRREVLWILGLGALIMVVRGMDSRTADLRRRAQDAARAQADAAALSAAPQGALPSVTAALGATSDDASQATISAAELAALSWGPNPFCGGPGRSALAADAPGGAVADAPVVDAPRLPRFQGLVRVRERTLAAIDGAFHGPGDRVGSWLIAEIEADGVTVRNVRTGETRRLARERAVAGR